MYLVGYKPKHGFNARGAYWPLAGRVYSFIVFEDQDEFERLIASQGTKFLVVPLTEDNISNFATEFYKSDSWLVGTELVIGNIVAMSLPIYPKQLGLRVHEHRDWKTLFKCSDTYLYTKDSWEGIQVKCPYAISYFSGGCELGSNKCERRFDALSYERGTPSK